MSLSFFSKIKSVITFVNFLDCPEEWSPKPATKYLPDWYKQTPSYINEVKSPQNTTTIKRCVPVFDALTAGYIIPTPTDVYVSIKDNGEIDYFPTIPGVLDWHPHQQAHLHPQANGLMLPKWLNQWGIKTPKGYSTMFLPPMHNPNPWFEILPGIVDTDVFTYPVNFPFILKDVKENFIIPAGTPMAQCIPFKRENWSSAYSKEKKEAESIFRFMKTLFYDKYRNYFWIKKQYK